MAPLQQEDWALTGEVPWKVERFEHSLYLERPGLTFKPYNLLSPANPLYDLGQSRISSLMPDRAG